MKARLPLFVIIAGSLMFLVSLYLTWFVIRQAPAELTQHDKGWGSSFLFTPQPLTQVAGLLALALFAIALAATIKPGLENLPVGATALAFGLCTFLSTWRLWNFAVEESTNVYSDFHASTHLGPGAYLGLTGVGIACAAAAVLQWREFVRRRSIVATTGQAILLVLLVSFVVPAVHSDAFPLPGVVGVFVCLAPCFALAIWSREGQPGLRLASAAAIATLAAGGYIVLRRSFYSDWPYELWLMVACAFALLVLALAGARSMRIGRPSASEAATAFAGVLVLVSLFLPWESGSTRGWWLGPSAMAGGLVLLLLVGIVARRRVYAELAIGAALYIMSAGLAITGGADGRTGLEYGALVGFVGGGLLFLVGLSTLRPLPAKRLLIRSISIWWCLALLVFPVAASTSRLSSPLVLDSPWLWLFFPGAATIVIALRLLLRWADGRQRSAEVVLLPLCLTAVTMLALTYARLGEQPPSAITWEGWASLALCMLLAAFGWIDWRSAYAPARTDGSASTTSLATSP